jgi:hypothetical protein
MNLEKRLWFFLNFWRLKSDKTDECILKSYISRQIRASETHMSLLYVEGHRS